MAPEKEISVIVIVVAVSSEYESIFTVKEVERT